MLEAVVVGADDALACPLVGPPVSHRLHQPDDFTLVRGELGVLGCDYLAEEGDRSLLLVQNGTKPHTRGVAVHHEHLVKVGELNRHHREGALEGVKRIRGCLAPLEGLPLEEGHQGSDYDAVVVDERG
jgi:hypothetical protein